MESTPLAPIIRTGSALALGLGALPGGARNPAPAIGLEVCNESQQPWTIRTVEAAGVRDPRDIEGHRDYQLSVREFWSDTQFGTTITAPSPAPGSWTLLPIDQKRDMDPAFQHYRINPTAMKAGEGGTFYFYLGGGNGICRLFKVTCACTGPKDRSDPYRMTFEVTPQDRWLPAGGGAGTARGLDPEGLAVVVDESRRRLTIKRDGYPDPDRKP